jgi:pimeloyl-ACP methyl ester carboxylesterase
VTGFAAWSAGGQRRPLALASGARFALWSRSDPAAPAAGPHATLLHGFPTHSLDWAKVVAALGGRVRTLAFDFLGFGSSDKPVGRGYSLLEQADFTEALWAQHGVTSTLLVAHDYGVSVAQELLARHAEGRLGVALAGAVFLNGGLWPDLHRALPVQKLLLDPAQGPKLSALVNEETFTRGLAVTFAPAHLPSAAESHETWRGVALRGGERLGHELIHYMSDRLANEARWVGALETTQLARHFVWGALDPVSGGHVLERIRERFPRDRVVALPDVGHWPSLEAPDAVVAAIVAAAGLR